MATKPGPLSSTNPQQEVDSEVPYGYKGLATLLLSFYGRFYKS